MPKGTYSNVKNAIRNAKYIIKKTKCDAVKLESNNNNYNVIKKLVSLNIPVMGHVGFTPQFNKNLRFMDQTRAKVKKFKMRLRKLKSRGIFNSFRMCKEIYVY